MLPLLCEKRLQEGGERIRLLLRGELAKQNILRVTRATWAHISPLQSGGERIRLLLGGEPAKQNILRITRARWAHVNPIKEPKLTKLGLLVFVHVYGIKPNS